MQKTSILWIILFFFFAWQNLFTPLCSGFGGKKQMLPNNVLVSVHYIGWIAINIQSEPVSVDTNIFYDKPLNSFKNRNVIILENQHFHFFFI